MHVVLPAPFGPMNPTSVPVVDVERHVVDGDDAAERDAQTVDLEQAHVASSREDGRGRRGRPPRSAASALRRLPARARLSRGGDAVGVEDRADDHADAGDDRLVLAEVEPPLHRGVHEAAGREHEAGEDHAGHGGDAADVGDRQQHQRHEDREALRRQPALLVADQPAGRSGDERRQPEGEQLRRRDVDPDRARRPLVRAHGEAVRAGRASPEVDGEQREHGERRDGDEAEHDARVVAGMRSADADVDAEQRAAAGR